MSALLFSSTLRFAIRHPSGIILYGTESGFIMEPSPDSGAVAYINIIAYAKFTQICNKTSLSPPSSPNLVRFSSRWGELIQRADIGMTTISNVSLQVCGYYSYRSECLSLKGTSLIGEGIFEEVAVTPPRQALKLRHFLGKWADLSLPHSLLDLLNALETFLRSAMVLIILRHNSRFLRRATNGCPHTSTRDLAFI